MLFLLCSMQLQGVTFAATENLISQCEQTLPPKYKEELKDFLIFLDENFKNKSSDSSLSNIAIQRFGVYKKAIKSIFGTLGPQAYEVIESDVENNITSFTEVNAYKSCQKITEDYIEFGKVAMMERIKSSSAQKSAAIMLEKYQAINMKLRELNIQISKMYALFMTFSNKLPGFLRECLR